MLRRRRKPEAAESSGNDDSLGKEVREREKEERRRQRVQRKKEWSCVDSCCWFVGAICCSWWFLLFLYNCMPALPQYVTEKITGPLPDPPGVKLQKEGLRVKHPVVFVPGIVTGGLELWEGHQCAEELFRKRLWGGTFGELYKSFNR